MGKKYDTEKLAKNTTIRQLETEIGMVKEGEAKLRERLGVS